MAIHGQELPAMVGHYFGPGQPWPAIALQSWVLARSSFQKVGSRVICGAAVTKLQPQQPFMCETFKNCSRDAFMDGNGEKAGEKAAGEKAVGEKAVGEKAVEEAGEKRSVQKRMHSTTSSSKDAAHCGPAEKAPKTGVAVFDKDGWRILQPHKGQEAYDEDGWLALGHFLESQGAAVVSGDSQIEVTEDEKTISEFLRKREKDEDISENLSKFEDEEDDGGETQIE